MPTKRKRNQKGNGILGAIVNKLIQDTKNAPSTSLAGRMRDEISKNPMKALNAISSGMQSARKVGLLGSGKRKPRTISMRGNGIGDLSPINPERSIRKLALV